jgi:hypothetical protein
VCIVPPAQQIASAYVVQWGRYGDVQRLAVQRGVARQRLYREATAVLSALDRDAQQQRRAALRQRIDALQSRVAQLEAQLAQAGDFLKPAVSRPLGGGQLRGEQLQ